VYDGTYKKQPALSQKQFAGLSGQKMRNFDGFIVFLKQKKKSFFKKVIQQQLSMT